MTPDKPTLNGSGSEPFAGDGILQGQQTGAVTRREDRSEHTTAPGARIINAEGLSVAPGFINPMSWAPISLLYDGRSMSDILQGVTLEVFGEAWSEVPLTEEMRQEVIALQGDIRYDISWSTLGGFLEHLEKKSVSTNIASFVGADTVRLYGKGLKGLGEDLPTPQEMERMVQAVRQKIKKWSDYVDYWAIDWDFQNDTFLNQWTSYRTRRDRALKLKSEPHEYSEAGTYRILVKVIDIFGNDTSQAFEVSIS
jgi:N-acyl-D-amino-acid deacylase